jgi:tetratricopeptide (TPR) repeat protein
MERKGDLPEARKALVRARDEDLLKFRAPSEINAVIRRVARGAGVRCVAADSLFSAESPDGVPGDSLFWEHLHPTLAGYYLLASGYTGALRSILGGRPFHPVPRDPDSLSIAWFELAYADLAIQHLTGRWPFRDYRRAPAVIAGADPAALKIVTAVYERRTPWNEGCYQSATFSWSRGDFRRARTTYEAMLEDYPWSFYTNYLLASLLSTSGERTQALPFYRRSIASNPGYPHARLELGLLLVNLADFDGAIEQLRPLSAGSGAGIDRVIVSTACYGLGAAYANRGELAKAMEILDRAIALRPGYADAERLRAQIRSAQRSNEGPQRHRGTPSPPGPPRSGPSSSPNLGRACLPAGRGDRGGEGSLCLCGYLGG